MTRLSILVVAVCLVSVFAQPADDVDVLEDQKLNNEETKRSAVPQMLESRRSLDQGAFNPSQGRGLPALLLQCYSCQNCPPFSNSTPTKICPPTFDVTKNKCVVYTEKYKQMSSPWVIRGCASERGSCADIKAAHDPHSSVLHLLTCKECEGDRCNSSGVGKSLPSLAVAFIALVVTPLLATSVFS